MVKKFTVIVFAGLLIYSCGQVKEQQGDSKTLSTISELVSEPLSQEGNEVSFEGVITHICKHSGDKMRINQVDDADYSILVMLNDLKPEFNAEFEGRQVRVTGIMKTQVRNMDELEATHEHEHAEGESHECSSTEEAVKAMQEKGISPDIIAFLELKSFEFIEVTEEENVVDVAEIPVN